MKRILLLIIAITGITFISCKKTNDHPAPGTDGPDTEEPAGDPVITEPGQPTGAMVQKSIGPSGGTLTSADGTAQLIIPAGALDGDQTITMQPVESKLPHSIQRNAYRIGPANLPFKKEADMVIKYSNKDAHDAPDDLIYIAGHESNGKWKMAGKVTRDKAARKMTAKIKKAKDYSVFEEYQLEDSKIKSDTAVLTLLVTEKVQFRVYRVSWYKDSVMELPVPFLVDKEVKEWSINGTVSPPVENPYGHFIEEKEKVKMNYIAPIKAPAMDTVAVSVRLNLDNKGLYLLVRNVVIVDQNSIILNGRSYNVKGAAVLLGGMLSISLSDLSNPAKQVAVNINMLGVGGPGAYAFSDFTAVTARDGGTPQKDWSSWYTDKDGKTVHAGGMVTISAGGITINKPLEGRIEGELLNVRGDKIERCSISGTFGVILGG